jgi:hypothetical protein
MLIYEEELSELGSMETNAVQGALLDTTTSFCKKTRVFRNTVFLTTAFLAYITCPSMSLIYAVLMVRSTINNLMLIVTLH